MKKSNKKILLSIVALILALMTMLGFTYAWIDDIKRVEFQNDNLTENGAPLKTGVDINSSINITNTNNTINLGNMFAENNYEDLVFEQSTTQHARYDTDPDNAAKEPNTETINNKKGYFYESGDMHLSPCYSDGEMFYFQKNSGGYREGNKDDENVNYISLTAKVSSPDANVSFWFENVPKIKDHTTNQVISKARYAITVDGRSHVYSDDGKANTINSSGQVINIDSTTRKTSDFTIRSADNIETNTESTNYKTVNNVEKNANANTLFSIAKGKTVNLNIKIWLESGVGASIKASDISMSLVSSWKYSRTITITDKTTAKDNSSWIGNNSATVFLTLPSVLKELNSSVGEWSNLVNAPFYRLTRSGDSYTVSGVPFIYNNEEMILYRCTDLGWNQRNTTDTNADDGVQRSGYQVYCWNWWQTNLPNSFCNEKYTLYGSSLDKTAKTYFPDITETNKGYGTWGDVVEITFDGKTKSVGLDNGSLVYGKGSDLASNYGTMFVVDFSDFFTIGEKYIYVMYATNNVWKTYIPVSSSLIQFYGNWDPTHYVYWGYHSWYSNNPQMRPVNSTTYYATQVVNHDGVGFWNGAEDVYLIASGSDSTSGMVEKQPYDNIYSSSVKSDASAERSQMTLTSDEYQGYKVYKSSKTGNNSPAHYYHIKFDNGTTGDSGESGEKALFPGCYFDWENNCWLGSLTGNERGGGGDTGGTGDDSSSGTATPITTGDPSEYGLYAYGQLSGGSSYVEYAKFSSTEVGGYILVNLTAGGNYQFMLRKGPSSGWTEFGINNSDSKTLKSSTNGESYNLISGRTQKLTLNVETTGMYRIQIYNVDSGSIAVAFYYVS